MTEPDISKPTTPPAKAPDKPGVSKPKPSKPLPDWKPLGSIRDYFTEQMKQDQFR